MKNARKEYLVALATSSTPHVWVSASDEKMAESRARQLWQSDDSSFVCKDGGIDGVEILDLR